MIADMISYTSDTHLEGILDMLKEWVEARVYQNLELFAKAGALKLEFPQADLDSERWDGTLVIHFSKPWSAMDVINHIISGTRADEIHMIDNKTLRLWWD